MSKPRKFEPILENAIDEKLECTHVGPASGHPRPGGGATLIEIQVRYRISGIDGRRALRQRPGQRQATVVGQRTQTF